MEERVFSDTTGNPASEPATDEARVLAELPPTSWPRTRQRFAALADYLRIASPTAEDVRRHASRLGVSPVTFQRVIAAHRALQTGREPKRSRRGLHRSLPPATAAIVEDVIAELGPNATDAAVHREAERRAIAKGLPVASPNAIRTRRGRGPQSVDLRSRLQLDFDAILDCCPLTFDVVDGSGEQRPAVLAALIAGADGEICGISLHAGFPSGTELVALAQRARTLALLRDVEAPVLVATWTARRELNGHRTALVDAGYVLGDASSVRLRGGSAITPRAANGRRFARTLYRSKHAGRLAVERSRIGGGACRRPAVRRRRVTDTAEVRRNVSRTVLGVLTTDGVTHDGILYRWNRTGITKLLSENLAAQSFASRLDGTARCDVTCRAFDWNLDVIEVFDDPLAGTRQDDLSRDLLSAGPEAHGRRPLGREGEARRT